MKNHWIMVINEHNYNEHDDSMDDVNYFCVTKKIKTQWNVMIIFV